MARYIKANPLVARYLQLDNDRNTVSDGNYLFWQNDMLKFGPLTQLNDILVKIGGIALLPHEAREEQEGTVCRPLPMATDARFQQPIKANVNDAIVSNPTDGDNENGSEGDANTGTDTSAGSDAQPEQSGSTEGQAKEDNAEESADPDPKPSESETNDKSNE